MEKINIPIFKIFYYKNKQVEHYYNTDKDMLIFSADFRLENFDPYKYFRTLYKTQKIFT